MLSFLEKPKMLEVGLDFISPPAYKNPGHLGSEFTNEHEFLRTSISL